MAQLIYVIEDDESIRTLLDAALTSEGYEVWGFSDASPALKAMAERRPALVIPYHYGPPENPGTEQNGEAVCKALEAQGVACREVIKF